MNFTENTKEAQTIINNIIQKCWENDNFKNKFINNPVEAIEEFTGKKYKLPDNKVLKVIDQSDENTIFLNIPRKGNIDDLELTDKELEAVAGGSVLATIALGVAACALYDFANGFIDSFR